MNVWSKLLQIDHRQLASRVLRSLAQISCLSQLTLVHSCRLQLNVNYRPTVHFPFRFCQTK